MSRGRMFAMLALRVYLGGAGLVLGLRGVLLVLGR